MEKIQAPEPEKQDLREFLRVLFQQKKLILRVTLAAFALSVLYVVFCHRTYESVSTVKVPESSASTQNAIRQLAFMPAGGDPIETYVEIAQSYTVALYVIEKLNLTSNPLFKGLSEQKLIRKLLKKVVEIVNEKESNLVAVKVDVGDPHLACDIANTWAEGFIQLNLDLNRQGANVRYQFIHNQLQEMKTKLDLDRDVKKNYLDPSNEAMTDEIIYRMLLQEDQEAHISENSEDSGIVVVDRAVVPENPIKPNIVLSLVAGLALGLLLSLQLAFALEKLRDHIQSEEDIQRITGAMPLAVIPNFRKKDGKSLFLESDKFSPKHLIEATGFKSSYYKESLKILRTNMAFSAVDRELGVLSVFSSNTGEGKTLTNSNLALSFAETGKRVLLVDADMRKPSVSILFGVSVPPKAGLPFLLSGNGKLSDMTVESGFPNLWLLPNGTVPPNPAELMGSEAIKRAIDEMRKSFDVVVFDCPPVLPVSDAVVLAKRLDGVILLARFDKTRRAELRRSYEQLRTAKAPLLGTVFNGVEIEHGLYGYGYGYGYEYGGERAAAGAPKK
jgi:capsular exopolysaccharide synthesis family protein